MEKLKTEFETMQRLLLELVEEVYTHHKKGSDFGTGHSLFPAEIHTIEAIGDEPDLTITRLAERLGVSKPTISERIKKLVKKGLVVKGSRPDNAKAVTLALTKLGWIAHYQHNAHHQRMFELFLAEYGQDADLMVRQFSHTFKEMIKMSGRFE